MGNRREIEIFKRNTNIDVVFLFVFIVFSKLKWKKNPQKMVIKTSEILL